MSVAFRPEPSQAELAAAAAKDISDAAVASDIITTEEELQAFMIVRAISARIIDVERVTLRDAKSYCSIFVDDNNRKQVCRFYFNAKNAKSIGIFDAQKVETKIVIDRISDIYKFSAQIEATVKSYF